MRPENGAGNNDNKLSRPGDEDASAGIQVSWPRKNIDLICNNGGAIACPGGKILRSRSQSNHTKPVKTISAGTSMSSNCQGGFISKVSAEQHLVQKENISPDIIMRRQTEGECKLPLWQLEGRCGKIRTVSSHRASVSRGSRCSVAKDSSLSRLESEASHVRPNCRVVSQEDSTIVDDGLEIGLNDPAIRDPAQGLSCYPRISWLVE